ALGRSWTTFPFKSCRTIWVAAMGKSKRAQDLTHEEIWDDSALVRSWDDAVEEYQLYHSIQAKGENVDDVLRRAEEEGIPDEDPPFAAAEDVVDDVSMEAETEDGAGTGAISQITVQDENLKRLMMSWYYAGYYTGLYEGQQQANQGKS
ncbi:uncharacterized protein N7477_008114, partial [Penicillium maclennaniae]|uniref:uncharacterized protein n=1 Tax=Penicillium maclennaniae TaxID=1343394 RepID=UPI002541AAF9